MYCKYLSKKVNGGFKCKKYKQGIISLDECKNCLEFDFVKNKPIKNRTNKQKRLEKNRYSLFTNNFNKCYYCHRIANENEKFDLHEVYGGCNRTRSIKNGLVVPLCRICHSNEDIIQYLRIKLQKEFEKTHSREEFIKIIGKSYIKEMIKND
jgi:hypothetical protein